MNGKILIVGRPGTAGVNCLNDVMPLLGEPVFYAERDLVGKDGRVDIDDLTSRLEHLGSPPLLFFNPYGQPVRLDIYRTVRAIGHPFVNFERGALPDSWFFDDNGCNADSTSYDRKIWDRPLSPSDEADVRKYIAKTIERDEHLERQGTRIGGDKLREKLGLGNEKVIFVPLQRPSDTVTVHMAGAIGSCDNFIRAIDAAAQELHSQGYVVLCKKHPLEVQTPALLHARYVPNDTHFLDLLELCESVALINSGVGVYAMMMGKPCFVFGEAFYAFDGINEVFTKHDAADLAERISSPAAVDVEAMRRFIHYLTKEFYSFGTAQTKERVEKDGSLRTITTGIKFYRVQLPAKRGLLMEAA